MNPPRQDSALDPTQRHQLRPFALGQRSSSRLAFRRGSIGSMSPHSLSTPYSRPTSVGEAEHSKRGGEAPGKFGDMPRTPNPLAQTSTRQRRRHSLAPSTLQSFQPMSRGMSSRRSLSPTLEEKECDTGQFRVFDCPSQAPSHIPQTDQRTSSSISSGSMNASGGLEQCNTLPTSFPSFVSPLSIPVPRDLITNSALNVSTVTSESLPTLPVAMAPLITEPSEDTNSQNQAWPNGSEIVQMLSPVTQSSHDVKNTGHDDDYPIVIDASDSGDMEDKAGLSSSTCKQDLDSLVHLVHDESSSSASDFTSPNTSMVAMQSQLHDQYIAQLVATDLTARTRQIGLLNQALEEKTSKLDQYSKENASLRVQLDQTLGEKAHLKKELGSLRMRVSQLENDKGMQEREISETTQRARELENECQTFVKRSIKLEERVSLLRERCVEFQHTLDGHATDATTLKVGISDLRRDAMSIKETRDSIKRTLESVSQVFKVVQEEQFEQKQMLIGQIEELKVNKMEQQETIRMQEKDIAQHCTDANAAREQLKGVSDQLEVSLAERDKLAQSNSVVLNYILEGKANLESNLEQFHDKYVLIESETRASNERYRGALSQIEQLQECVVHLQKAVQEKDQSIRDLVNQNQIQALLSASQKVSIQVMNSEIERQRTSQDQLCSNLTENTQLAPASKEESVPERLLGCHEKVDQEVSSSDLKRKASDLMATKEQDNDVDVKVFKRAISEEDPGFPAPTCSTAQDQPDSTKAVAEGAAGEGCKGEAVDPIGCHKSTPESSQPEVQRKAKRGRPRKSEQGRANSAKGKAVAVS